MPSLLRWLPHFPGWRGGYRATRRAQRMGFRRRRLRTQNWPWHSPCDHRASPGRLLSAHYRLAITLANKLRIPRFVSTPWAVDGLAGAESDALDNFTKLAGESRDWRGRSWSGGGSLASREANMGALAGLSGIDPELAHTVADVAWVKDGPGPLGAPALLYLHRMSESAVALAKSVASATWFTDHVSLNERQAIERLTELSHAHSVTADTIARHPLLLEGLLADTGSTVHSLQRMAELDEALAGDLLTLLWPRWVDAGGARRHQGHGAYASAMLRQPRWCRKPPGSGKESLATGPRPSTSCWISPSTCRPSPLRLRHVPGLLTTFRGLRCGRSIGCVSWRKEILN